MVEMSLLKERHSMMKRFITLLMGLCVVVADGESAALNLATGTFFSDTSAAMPLDLTANPVARKVGETVDLEYSPLFSSEPCNTVRLNEVGSGVTNKLCESSMAGAFVWSSRKVGIHSLALVFLRDGVEVGAWRMGCAEVWDDSIVLDCMDVPLRQLLPTTYGFVSHVTLADGVTTVPDGFFAGCTNLASVTIPASVTGIGSSAFLGCTGIRAVVLNGNVNMSMRSLFPDAYASVTNVVLGAGVSSVWGSLFDGCGGLTSFVVAQDNPNYSTLNGLLVSKDGRTLIRGVNSCVTIPDGVEHIGDSAFSGCSGLTSVAIPASVTGIGSSAFLGCTGIRKVVLNGNVNMSMRSLFPDAYASVTNVVLGAGVSSVEGRLFDGCGGLTSFVVAQDNPNYSLSHGLLVSKDGKTLIRGVNGCVTIPDGVEHIGDSAFSGCSGLTSVTIPEGVTSIGDGAFSDCSGLASVTIPDSVTRIGDFAFHGCSGLTSVTIPDGVTSIGYRAFQDCSGLASVTIPDSVTRIGAEAFYGCRGLASVVIPNGVTSIGSSAFSGCSGLTSVTIPDSVTSIGDWAFYGCSGLTSVTIPDGVTSIGDGAFYGCSGLTSVTIPDGVTRIGGGAFDGCSGLTSVTIPDGVTSIGNSAFEGCSGLTSVTIPDSVTSIGDRAFKGCSGLASVTIPSSVTRIWDWAFEGCSGLASVTIPDGVTSIGGYAFYGCSGLTSIKIPEGVTSIGDCVFFGCSGLASVTIPDGVTSIGWNAFSGCSGLMSVSIPASVTSIGNYAFEGCTGIRDVMLGGNLDKPMRKFFPDAYASVTNVVLGSGVTSIGDYAFSGCSGLTSVTIPDSVTSIGDRVFYDCSSLTSIKIPDGVTSIGDSALNGCSGLTSVKIPRSVMRIGASAFSGCSGLTSVSIPDGVTSIGDSAFKGCSGLTSVTIPSSVTHVGWDAFDACADALYDATTIPGVRLVDGWAVGWCSGISPNLDLAGVRGLADGVFFGCGDLTSVAIPADVTSIGDGAFSGCTAVRSVEWRCGLSRPFAEIFPDSYASLTNVMLGAGVLALPAGVFNGCEALANVAFPATLTDFGDNDLRWLGERMGKSGLWMENGWVVGYIGTAPQEVTIPDGVKGIAAYAFEGQAAVVSVTIPCGVTRIGRSAFSGCSALSAVTIPSSVTDVGMSAFAGCEGIRTVAFEALPQIPKGLELVEGSAWIEEDETLNGATVWRSNVIGHNQSTELAFDIPVGMTDFVFSWKVGSEANYDKLTWYLDEVEKADISGSQDWRTVTNALDGAAHRARFVYSKDGSASTAPDCGWVSVEIGGYLRGLFPGSYASLTNVTLGAEITALPDGFFVGCAGLRRFEILSGAMAASATLKELMPDVCASLTEVVLGPAVKALSDGFFDGCDALMQSDEMDWRSLGAQMGKQGLWIENGWALGYIGEAPATVAVPDGVKGIAAHAFAGQDALASVAFPDTLEYVGVGAFRLCTGLARIDLPDGVVRVDDGAFQDCTWVRSLAAPASLRTVGAAAFAHTANLGKAAFADGLLEIGPAAFSNAWRMLSVSLPVSVTNVGEDAFWNCKNLAGVTAPTHLAPLAALFPAAYGSLTSVAVAAGETALAPGVFAGCAALEAVDLPAAVDNIPDAAFRGCASLRQAVFPAAVTNVGAEAFSGCASLVRLDFPEGLRSVGARAFDGVVRLAEVRLPAGLKTLGEAAFANCPDVRAVAVRGELGALASFLPDAFAAVETVEIAPGTASLAPGFLEGCASLRALEIPASVTAIGDRALAGCAGVAALAFPDGLRALGAHACDGMALLTEVAIPDGTAAIGEGAFANCPAVRRVTMPGGVVPVRTAFPDTFAQLSEVGVTPGTARLVDGFFAGCAALSEIGVPVGVSALGTGVFRDCAALVKVALPEGLSELPDESFAGCASLPSLVIPASVSRLGARVFAGCTALRGVQFLGDAPSADAAAYADAPAELVTYVADGTRGWDGIETSRNLPEAWPAGAANAIATWTPTRLGVTFDARGGEPAETVLEETVGTTYRLPQPDPSRLGATFLGWWTETGAGAEVRPTTRVVLTGDHTLYAHWRLHGYAVAFDANGGVGEMAPVARTVGVAAALPPSAFRRAGHDFAGWALSPDGEAAFADGADPGDLAYGDGDEVTLYAVWRERAWTAADWLDAPGLAFSCAGDADWRPDAEESHDGVGSMRSGTLGTAPKLGTTVRSTLKAVVRGRGVLLFWWKVVCEPGDSATGDLYDYLELTVDGKRPASVDPIAGETGWARVEVRIDDASAHEVAWSFVKDDWDEAVYADVAWVDEVTWTPDAVTLSFDGNGATEGAAPEPIPALSGEEVALPGPGTLVRDGCRFDGWSDGERTYAAGEAYVAGGEDVTFAAVWKELSVGDVLDAPGLAFTAGGDAKWIFDSAVSHDGAAALRSGAVEVGQSCWIETSVTGAGTLSFWWKAEGLTYRGKPANYVDVSVDGAVAATAVVTNWTLVTVQVEGSGAHTVRWSYRQTRAQTTGGACAWLDEVVWTPAPTAPGVVCDEGATVTGDAEGGFTVTPGARAETVEVTVPDGLDAAKVTVEVPPTVKTVKVPTGVKVKVMSDGHDITAFLDIPKADASGTVDLAFATVKDEIAREPLDTGKGAEIHLDDPSEPTLKTAPTKPGLVYTLREGATLDAMADGDTTVGDGAAWTPDVKVKGGASGFYTIRVSKE